jgi:hypothetical protein
MVRRKAETPPAPVPARTTAEEVQGLTRAVEELVRQTRQLGLILDDIRQDLIHAVKNGTFSCSGVRDEAWRPIVTPPNSERRDTAEAPEMSPRVGAEAVAATGPSAGDQGTLFQ